MAIVNDKIKVLLFENDSSLADLLQLALEPFRIDLSVAKSIQESLDGILTRSPDIIIIDLNEQGEQNCQVCTEIRKITRIPILVLSPFDSPKIVATALNAGADDYLTKPIQLLELKARIESLIKRNPAKLTPISLNA
jgi:DNA-binding response OmpR family regulator